MRREDLLIELGTEELPPKALRALRDAFAAGVAQELTVARLDFGTITAYATPRRLAPGGPRPAPSLPRLAFFLKGK